MEKNIYIFKDAQNTKSNQVFLKLQARGPRVFSSILVGKIKNTLQ